MPPFFISFVKWCYSWILVRGIDENLVAEVLLKILKYTVECFQLDTCRIVVCKGLQTRTLEQYKKLQPPQKTSMPRRF